MQIIFLFPQLVNVVNCVDVDIVEQYQLISTFYLLGGLYIITCICSHTRTHIYVYMDGQINEEASLTS